jgi:NADP-dependent 3-hydroxy acid dehydrogenase YdfG
MRLKEPSQSPGYKTVWFRRACSIADRLQKEFGNGFVPLRMDITDADAVHQAAQKVGSMIGDRNLVGLVNNAGIVVTEPRPFGRSRQAEDKGRYEIDLQFLS